MHKWVRDNIHFGFYPPSLYAMRASDVLTERIGFCNTQSTLLVALLRAAGIPARIRFMALGADILHGYGIPGPLVDHSITEVYNAEASEWVPTDSYIVDPPLFSAAKARLLDERLERGYGINLHGTTEWDGVHAAFAQAVPAHSPALLPQGVFRDVADYYASCPQTHNGSWWLRRVIFPLVGAGINARIRAVRLPKMLL
ncbi:hypothetical protein HK102_011882 [Quaeritorhiza haematococci]|nr:hypothetical protein HK102_011882 [Quaeritorhiza haematococci]